MDYLLRLYNKKNQLISSTLIKDRTELEAEREHYDLINAKNVNDWTLSEVIGYQIDLDRFGDMHPLMSASFCIYSYDQCVDMINNDSRWTILPICEGDIEEPTFML